MKMKIRRRGYNSTDRGPPRPSQIAGSRWSAVRSIVGCRSRVGLRLSTAQRLWEFQQYPIDLTRTKAEVCANKLSSHCSSKSGRSGSASVATIVMTSNSVRAHALTRRLYIRCSNRFPGAAHGSTSVCESISECSPRNSGALAVMIFRHCFFSR